MFVSLDNIFLAASYMLQGISLLRYMLLHFLICPLVAKPLAAFFYVDSILTIFIHSSLMRCFFFIASSSGI